MDVAKDLDRVALTVLRGAFKRCRRAVRLMMYYLVNQNEFLLLKMIIFEIDFLSSVEPISACSDGLCMLGDGAGGRKCASNFSTSKGTTGRKTMLAGAWVMFMCGGCLWVTPRRCSSIKYWGFVAKDLCSIRMAPAALREVPH